MTAMAMIMTTATTIAPAAEATITKLFSKVYLPLDCSQKCAKKPRFVGNMSCNDKTLQKSVCLMCLFLSLARSFLEQNEQISKSHLVCVFIRAMIVFHVPLCQCVIYVGVVVVVAVFLQFILLARCVNYLRFVACARRFT